MNASAHPSNKAVRKGLAHLNAGRIGDAERLFRSVLKSEPDNPDANHALGTLAVRQGNLPLALRFLTAALQATWLGFTTTTGVAAIDCRITDPHTDPPGMTEHYNTETPWRLPATFCVYQPRADIAEPIDHPPRDDNGFTTFGRLNNFTKVNDRTLKRWAEILARAGCAAASGDRRHRIAKSFVARPRRGW